jgi:hypothetical protein
MRRSVKATTGAIAAALITAICTTPAPAATHAAGDTRTSATKILPAYFKMTDVTGRLFTVEMTNPKDIEHARALLSGKTREMSHVMGRIVKSKAWFNTQWGYHIDSRTVSYFDFATEVCDATIPYVQEHLAEAGGAFLPGLTWCDWSSRLVREVPAP